MPFKHLPQVPWQRYRGADIEPNLNRRGQQYVGRRITLSEDFRDGSGRLQLDDTWWPARAADGRPIASGRLVEIIAVSGIEVQVKEC
ncbi:MAG: NfeD family protein [Proteobacteria bacterium]|nr:NfeD family protein [Pseudomonadota bacterium]